MPAHLLLRSVLLRPLLIACVALLCIGSAVAQGTFPVQVSGALVPPRSLDLSVYGQDRADDLFFDLILNDPTEEILEVRIAVSIERNGQIVYQTDPNAALPTITLQQFEPFRVDGPTLLRYLSANAAAAGGLDGAAFEVPEGLNSLCLQVFGVERDVAISRNFCTQGSFQLNLVPRLTLPEMGAEIRHTDPQNLVFTWVPMHLGSTNPPQPVEYDFELVELPRGYYNANDAFRSALRVYDVTTSAPTVVMGPGEPQLRADAVYAWRVRARSSLYPTSKLFQNDGYSQVSSFALYSNEPFSQVNFITDNPAPQGCTVFATEYPLVSGDPGAAMPLGSGDVVKLGYFNMKVTEASGSPSSGYGGKGLVDFPMLNSKVEVVFTGLLVGEDRRVFAVDRVDGVVVEGFALSDGQISRENIATSVDSRYVRRLESLVTGPQGRARLVSGRDASSEMGTNLPLALDREGESPVVVTGIRFTPRGAYLNLVSWTGKAGVGQARYAATAVQATPYGLRTGAHLVPLQGGAGMGPSMEPITQTIGLALAGNQDARMQIDCAGFASLNSPKELQVDPGVMVEAGSGAPIRLNVKQSTEDGLRSYVGEVQAVAAFVLPEVPGYTFTPGRATLDLSEGTSQYPAGARAPYSAAVPTAWRGLTLHDVNVELAENYGFTEKGKPIVMQGGQLFVDDAGAAYGRFAATKVRSLGSSRAAGAVYSVDTLALRIDDNQAQALYYSGDIKVPVFPDPFRTRGTIDSEASKWTTLSATVPTTPRAMPMWMGTFTPYETSTVGGQFANLGGQRELFLRAGFDGVLSLKLTEAELVAALPEKGRAELAQSIKQVLGVSSLALSVEDLLLEDLHVDPAASPKERVSLGAANATKATAKMGTKTLEWGEVHTVYRAAVNGQPEGVGLEFALYDGDNRVKFTLWSRMGEQGHYVFESIAAEGSKLTCNCTSFVPTVDEGAWGAILDGVIDAHFGDLVGLAGSSGKQASPKPDAWATAHAALRLQLDATARGGFPFLDAETTVIPWLKNLPLTVEAVDGVYKGVSHIPDLDALTFAALSSVPANKLPIDVTDRLTELGIKKDNMPAHSRLLITGFTVGKTATLAKGASMELTLLYEVEYQEDGAGGMKKDYLAFVSDTIPTGPQSVDFSDRRFTLRDTAVMGGERDRVRFLPAVTFTVNEGDEDNPKVVSDTLQKSFAVIDCHGGFRAFDVQAVYEAPFGSKASDAGSQLAFRFPKIENQMGAGQARFYFRVNTAPEEVSHSLRYFIAPLSGKLDRADGEGLNFTSVGAEAIIFRLGDSSAMRAFIDYTQTAKVEGSDDQPLFRGLYFENINWELDGFLGPKDEPLTLPIGTVKFDFNRGLSAYYEQGLAGENGEGASIGIAGAKASSYDAAKLTAAQRAAPLPRDAGARMGGWKFGVSYAGFKLVDGRWAELQQIPGASAGVKMEGAMHVPIFEENAKTIMKGEGSTEVLQTFESGWIKYAGTVTFNSTGNSYAPESTLRFVPVAGDKVFQSSHIPFLGYRISKGSSINLDWAGEDKQFEPKATFNGFAGIYLVPGVAKMLGIEGAAATSLSGISLKHELLEFKGLTLNVADSECDPGDTADKGLMTGIKSIDFGEWGPLTGNRADSLSRNIAEAIKADFLAENPMMKGFPVSLDRVSIACFATDTEKDRYRLTLGATLNLMGDAPDGSNGNKGGEPKLGATTPTDATTTVAETSTASGKITRTKGQDATTTVAETSTASGKITRTKGTDATTTVAQTSTASGKITRSKGGNASTTGASGATGESEKASTAGLKASGEVNLVFRTSTGFTGVEVNCLLVEGKLATASITGGLNIFRADGQDTKWGDGFKAGLDLTLEGAGVGIKAVGQFGTTTFTPGGKVEAYRYGFIDLEGTYENGFPLPPPTPTSPPVANLYGLGGGILINMDIPPGADVLKGGESPVKLADARENDNCKIEGDMLRPGVNLYGMEYRPYQGKYGGNVSVIAGNYIPPGTPKPFVGDITLRIGITTNTAGTFAFDYVKLNGNGYIKPKSVAERRVDHVAKISVDIEYSTATKILQGDVTVAASYPNDGGELVARRKTEADVQTAWKDKSLSPEAKAAKIASIRADTAALKKLQKDSESEKYFVLENMRASLAMNFDTKEWGFKLGSWGDGKGVEPQSRLQYAAVKFPKFLQDSKAQFYLQAGNQVDGIPPIEEIMPAWTASGSVAAAGERNPEQLKAGTGVAFGAMLDIDSGQKKVGPFSGYVRGRAGLDLSLLDRSGMVCGQTRNSIGLNGWYGQGQAYLFADGRLNIDYDVWCCSGNINIFDAKMSAIVQAQLPNPSYLSGAIDGKYSVLRGLVKGSFNYKFAVGEKCETFTDNTAEIAGIQIISDVYPGDGSDAFDITGAPRLVANIPLGETIDFPVYDSEMKEKSREYFRPVLKEVKLTNDASGAAVNLAVQYDQTRQEITLQPDRWLDSKTKYRLSYRVEWEEDRDGDGTFAPLKHEKGASAGQVMAETGTRTFTSGNFPEVIDREMLVSQAPGYRQRFWHEGYASPLLRFKHGDPRLGREMFKDDGQTENGTPVRYEYYAEISRVLPQGASSAATPIRLPITRRPGQQTFRKPIYGETSVGNWTLPTVRYDTVTVREVEFPGLDDIDLEKGAVYRIRIIQEGVSAAATSVATDQTTSKSPNQQITTKKINTAAIAQSATPVKVLYEYEFGVSRYNSLHDKLAEANVAYQRANVRRDDLQGTRSEYKRDWNRNNPREFQFMVADDYWTVNPSKEGFDLFDLRRVRNNVSVSYLDNWMLEQSLQWRLEKEKNGPAYLAEGIRWYKERQSDYGSYGADVEYILKHDPRTLREEDGTTWAYNLVIAPGSEQLSDNEIKSGHTAQELRSSRGDRTYQSGNGDVFGQELTYGLLYQDLRSRVQTGRARWMAVLGDDLSYPIETHLFGCNDYGKWRHCEDDARTKYMKENFRSVVEYRLWGYDAQPNDGNNPLTFHPGYASSYHGKSRLSFPKMERWADMDQVANSGNSLVSYTLRPDHGEGKYPDGKRRDEKATVDKANPALSSPALGIIRNEFGNQVNAVNLPSGRRLKYVYIVTAPDARPVALVDLARRSMTRYSATGKIDNTTYESDVTWFSGGSNLEIKNLPGWTYSSHDKSATSRAHLRIVLADESGTFSAEQNPNSSFVQRGGLVPRFVHDNPFGPVTPLSNDAFAEVVSRFSTSGAAEAYEGIAVNLPGALKLDRFDEGGPGVAYVDSDLRNSSATPYLREGVDLERRGQSHALVSNDDGEWQLYTVEFKQAGVYKVSLDYTPNEEGTIQVILPADTANLKLLSSAEVRTSGDLTAKSLVLIPPTLVNVPTKIRLLHGLAQADVLGIKFDYMELPKYVFDAEYYSVKHRVGEKDALTHFMSTGLAKMLPSSPVFQLQAYGVNSKAVQKIASSPEEALIYFIEDESKYGPLTTPTFSVRDYRNANPRLSEYLGDDYRKYFEHYMNFGRYQLGSEELTVKIFSDPARQAPIPIETEAILDGYDVVFRAKRDSARIEAAFPLSDISSGSWVVNRVPTNSGHLPTYSIRHQDLQDAGYALEADPQMGWVTYGGKRRGGVAYHFREFEAGSGKYEILAADRFNVNDLRYPSKLTFDGKPGKIYYFTPGDANPSSGDSVAAEFAVVTGDFGRVRIRNLPANRKLEKVYVSLGDQGAPVATFDLTLGTRTDYNSSRLGSQAAISGITRKGDSRIELDFVSQNRFGLPIKSESEPLSVILVFAPVSSPPSGTKSSSSAPEMQVWTGKVANSSLQPMGYPSRDIEGFLRLTIPGYGADAISATIKRGF